jgi:hypothetical protein
MWTIRIDGTRYDQIHTLTKHDCPLCGATVAGLIAGRTCAACNIERTLERNRANARSWRQRKGLIKRPDEQQCPHCLETFTPKRSTAQFCSTRCRVAAHRGKGDNVTIKP